MIKFSNRRSAAMMTSASVLVLAAIAPAVHAQQTDIGAPGKALTAGTISTTTGNVNDNGANNGVLVIVQSTPVVVVTGAEINTTATSNRSALDIGASQGGTGPITVNFAGVSNIVASGAGVQISGVNQDTTVNTGSGNTITAGQNAVTGNTQAGSLTINNGANILSGATGINGSGLASVNVNSTGGTISAVNFGISAIGFGGPVTVGQGSGITTAITTTGAGGTGISAIANGGSAVSVRTGAGGTINGGANGISVGSNGAGAVTVNVGAAIGGTSAPTSRGVSATSFGGNVVVNTTAAITGGQNGVFASTTGAGSVTVGTGAAVTSTSFDGVYLSSQTGNVDYTLNGANTVRGSTGVTANSTSGAIAIRAANAGSAIIGNIRAVDARTSGGGAVAINLAGTTTGGIVGIVANGGGSVTIQAAGVNAANDAGISATTTSGAIGITANGAISANSYGILLNNAGAGTINVLASGPVTSATANGIAATNTGLGAVTVGAADNRIGAVSANGASGTGITAFGAGDVTVYASSVSGGTRGIVAANQYANPNGKVLVDVTGPVVGLNSWGIIGVNNGALSTNSLTINTGDVTGTGRTAISAETFGGDINIATSGAILSRASQTLTSNSAVFAESETNGLITIDTLGTVTGYDGIYALSDGTAGGIDIFSAAAVTGTNQYGIYGRSGGGNVAIESRSQVSGAIGGVVGTVAGAGSVDIRTAGVTATNGPAILGQSTTGAVTINVGGAIAAPVIGISGSTTSGALTINTARGGTIAPGAFIGIQATTQTGAITINQAGSIGSAGAGNTVANGIFASIASGTAAININSSGGIYVTPGTGLQSAGIYAFNGGTGAVNVVSTGVIDPGAYGVVVQGSGPVSYAANGGLVEGDQGVYVASTGNGPVTVTSTAGTVIKGLNGVGLQATSAGGAVNVASAGSVSGTTSGIVASTSGAGATTVTNTGAIVSGSGPAINVQSGTGGLVLNVGGSVVSATGPAIIANSTGGGTINVASGAVIAGRVDSPTGSVIALNTASGTTSTINVAQGATVQAVSGSPFTTAIRATGGSVVVNNSGVIAGQIDFSALTGANTGQLAGGAGTTFQTGGLSTFSAGNDTFTNAGQLVTVGTATTFDFRGGTNVFNNNGQVFVGSSPVSAAGSTFLLSSLTTFNNAGSLNLVNGVLGDSIVAPGANYIGSAGARLLVDTAIVPGGRSDFLTVGTTSGVTSVTIRDTAPTGFGAYNPTGIVIVNGVTHAGDFVLNSGSSFYNAGVFGGAIDKPGLFFSQLGVNGAGQTVLVSLPKVQAYQFSTLASQAQAVWYETAPRAARQAEVRDQLASGNGAGGFWVDVQGTHTARDVDRKSPTLAGIKSYDASYGQDVTSATIGYDAVRPMMDGDVVFGASVAYVNSSADFDKQSTSVDMDGVSGSAYASFVRSGWFVAGTVGVTQLNAEIKAPRLTGFTEQETDISSVGATLEAGFRAPFIMGTTIEPTAALAYVNTSVDDFVAAGSNFRFEDGESLRPSIGARVSGDANFGASWATRYNVSVRAVGEALSENAISVGSAGPNLRVVDQFENAYGEVKAGLTSQSANGWSVFGDVTGRYSDEVRAVGASVGMRLRY